MLQIVPVARLEAFRALKLSRLETFRAVKLFSQVRGIQGGPKTLESGEFLGPKMLQAGLLTLKTWRLLGH